MICIHDSPTSFPHKAKATPPIPLITTVNLTLQIPTERRNQGTTHLPNLPIATHAPTLTHSSEVSSYQGFKASCVPPHPGVLSKVTFQF